MIQSGMDIGRVITHRFSYKDFQQGFDVMRSGNSGKVDTRLERAMSLDESLRADLAAMEKAGTLKTFRHITGPMDTEVTMAEKSGRVLVLSSNNYLGLADHPEVIAAGKKALDDFGAGTASVRFICGTFSIHDQIEKALAKLSHTEAALTYVSCWTANTGLIPAIAGEADALVSDELNHASLIDGCRGAKAKRLVYKHSDMNDLHDKLHQVNGARRIFIVTDGVFSMEGDNRAPAGDCGARARTQRFRHPRRFARHGRDGEARPRHG